MKYFILILVFVLISCDQKEFITNIEQLETDVEVSDNDAVEQEPRVEKRLKAVNYVTPQGNKQFVNWYDSKFELQCLPKETVDGVKCLPVDSTLATKKYFEDSICTQPAFLAYSGCKEIKFIHDTEDCGNVSEVYEIVGEETIELYQVNDDGECVEAPFGEIHVWLVDKVELDSFVSFEIKIGE